MALLHFWGVEHMNKGLWRLWIQLLQVSHKWLQAGRQKQQKRKRFRGGKKQLYYCRCDGIGVGLPFTTLEGCSFRPRLLMPLHCTGCAENCSVVDVRSSCISSLGQDHIRVPPLHQPWVFTWSCQSCRVKDVGSGGMGQCFLRAGSVLLPFRSLS